MSIIVFNYAIIVTRLLFFLSAAFYNGFLQGQSFFIAQIAHRFHQLYKRFLTCNLDTI